MSVTSKLTESELLAFLLRFMRLCAKQEMHDSFWWRTDGDYAPVTIFAPCNDFFHWGCADLERVTPDNIGMLEKACEDCRAADDCCSHYGELLFCARLRGMRPQGAYYKHLPKELHHLFDACGPLREVGLGNPKKHPSEEGP